MAKKVAGIALVLAALWAVWWTWPGSPDHTGPPAPSEAPGIGGVTARVLTTAAGGAPADPDRTVVGRAPGRVAAAELRATLLVEARWEDDGSPVAGVPLLLRWRTQPVGLRVRTDTEGRAVFDDLDAGDYVLRTLHGNVYRQPSLTLGEQTLESVVIPRGHRLSGIVVGPSGEPVAAAEIVAIQGGTDPQWSFSIGTADAAGRFEIEGIGALDMIGARNARLGASDLTLVQTELRGDDPPRELRLVLPGETAALRGRVVDEHGTAVVGAWVRVGAYGATRRDDHGSAVQGPPGAIRMSGADGTFAIDMLRPGTDRLRVHSRGFAPHDAPIELPPYRTLDLVIVLSAGASLHGTVRDGDGEPVANAAIAVEDSWFPATTNTDTDGAGAFALDDLPIGRELTITATARGFATVERALTLVSGERATWHIELSRGRVLRARLVDERGDPLVGWFVGSDRHERRAKTGDDGRFVFPGCEAEAHRLTVRATWGFEPIVTTFADVWPRDDEREFVVADSAMPSARIRGHCTTADGTALPGITIDLHQGSRPVLPGKGVVRTDRQGRFETPLLPPGHYSLRPAHAELEFETQEIELRAGEQFDAGELSARTR